MRNKAFNIILLISITDRRILPTRIAYLGDPSVEQRWFLYGEKVIKLELVSLINALPRSISTLFARGGSNSFSSLSPRDRLTGVNRYPTRVAHAFRRALHVRAVRWTSSGEGGGDRDLSAHRAIRLATWRVAFYLRTKWIPGRRRCQISCFPRSIQLSLPFSFVSSAKYGCVHGTDR